MEKVVFGSIFILAFVIVCYADDVTDEDILKTLLNRESGNKLRDIIGELLEENPNIESLVSSEERQIPKRIFCNGAVGCLNRMNRRTEGTEDVAIVNKRPFCNGFFGCGNGKRSFKVPVFQEEPEKSAEKRLFCNMNGCGNMGKRSLYSTLLDRLQPATEEKSLNV